MGLSKEADLLDSTLRKMALDLELEEDAPGGINPAVQQHYADLERDLKRKKEERNFDSLKMERERIYAGMPLSVSEQPEYFAMALSDLKHDPKVRDNYRIMIWVDETMRDFKEIAEEDGTYLLDQLSRSYVGWKKEDFQTAYQIFNRYTR